MTVYMEQTTVKRRKKHKIYAVRYKVKMSKEKKVKIYLLASLLTLCVSLYAYSLWQGDAPAYIPKVVEPWETDLVK